jgi:hypothetical protein
LPSNDAPNIPAAAAPAAGACTNYEKDLNDVWNTSALFPRYRESIPLDETRQALQDKSAAITDVIVNKRVCGSGVKDKKLQSVVDLVANSLQGYRAKDSALSANASAATIQFPYQIDNAHYYVFSLRERARFNGMLTNATLTWRCGLEDILTLSLGVMGTTVPYRTYSSQSEPSGNSTQNVLTVSGGAGWTPQGLAMLNYKLWVSDRGPQPGFAISTGPAFKFGGTPQVSSLGWFAGVSFSLWRRLFISPGIHLGQFADYPPGFTNGSVVPASFSQLNPVTRWTGHLAIGLTFRTNSLAKTDNSTPPSSSPPKQ